MASEVLEYVSQLQKLKSSVPRQAYEIVGRLQDKIIPFITERQLYEKGIDGKGKFLGHYSPYTIALKKQKGEVYSHTTLLDTGDFYEGFFALGKAQTIVISSKDSKRAELVERYGNDIFTLTVENNQIVNNEIILPALVEWLLTKLEI